MARDRYTARVVRQFIYRLMRLNKETISLIKFTSNTPNWTTGRAASVWETHEIPAVRYVAKKSQRDFVQDLAAIAGGKNFTEGGYFDRKTTVMIFFKKDLPTDVTIDNKDRLRFDSQDHMIKTIDLYYDVAYFAYCKTVTGGRNVNEP